MTRNRSLPVKAMFLLIVFLLNTVVGFGCDIGTDMALNKSHHQHGVTDDKHQHADSDHHNLADHMHAEHHHGDEKENCCKDEVVKLTASNKLMPRIFDLSQLSMPFILLSDNVYLTIPVVSLQVNAPNAYFTRQCRSPIRDVRIAIQSFQI